jgi:predicted DCC family thiol-disulfide oxidoreductase YuxK
VCGLCSGVVDFTMREDRTGRFRFSPLQSQHAARVLRPEQTTRLETVVLRDGDETLEKSDAVIRLAEHLGGLWRLAALGRVLPLGLRNWAYDQVAAHRYRIFGKKESCRMPTPSERARFIL